MTFIGFLLGLAVGVGVMYFFGANRGKQGQQQNDGKRQRVAKNPAFNTEFGEMDDTQHLDTPVKSAAASAKVMMHPENQEPANQTNELIAMNQAPANRDNEFIALNQVPTSQSYKQNADQTKAEPDQSDQEYTTSIGWIGDAGNANILQANKVVPVHFSNKAGTSETKSDEPTQTHDHPDL